MNDDRINQKTYLIPRYEYDGGKQQWFGWIEERTDDEADEMVFGWYIGYFMTAHQALEAVTNEFVRMNSNELRFYGLS